MPTPQKRPRSATLSQDDVRSLLEDIHRQNQHRRPAPLQFGFKVMIYLTVLLGLIFSLYGAVTQVARF